MQWMDTSILYDYIYNISPWFAEKVGTDTGVILPEMLLNIDALFIIIFQIFISERTDTAFRIIAVSAYENLRSCHDINIYSRLGSEFNCGFYTGMIELC